MRLLGQLLGRLHTTDNGSGEALYGPDHLGNTRPHVLLSLYGQWMDRYAHACKLALDARVDERMLRLAESDADRLFTAITAAFETAGLDEEQREAFRVALAAELRAV